MYIIVSRATNMATFSYASLADIMQNYDPLNFDIFKAKSAIPEIMKGETWRIGPGDDDPEGVTIIDGYGEYNTNEKDKGVKGRLVIFKCNLTDKVYVQKLEHFLEDYIKDSR